MTITDDGSPQSGWGYDQLGDYSHHTGWGVLATDIGRVWRYGTERPCNLVGRYVSIVADYSSIPTHEIALCNWGVMGREPIVDEVIEPEPEPEPVPPTFSEILRGKFVLHGEAYSWTLPEVTTTSAALADIVVVPDQILTNIISYDAETRNVTFSGSEKNLQLHSGSFGIKITLKDVNGLT